MTYLARAIEPYLLECLTDTPVIVITGPRQSGKTTLTRQLIKTGKISGGSYLTLDDENILTLAKNDPIGLLKRQPRPVVIDEVQRAPEIIRTVKLLVDEDRQPGSFILTGSADLMTLPTLADSMAGRAEFITLYPLSQAELKSRPNPTETMASRLEKSQIWPELQGILDEQQLDDGQLLDAIVAGGYPEAVNRVSKRRTRWHKAYADAIIQRDISEVFQLKKLDELGLLLKLLAAITSEPLNYSSLGKAIQMDTKSVQKYICALENLYLIKRIPAWHKNELKRAIKQPKIHFIDTGLLCSLRGLSTESISADRNHLGPLMENFVCTELLKSIAASDEDYQLFHYRDKDKKEVDFILTNNNGKATGIEVKATMTIQKNMFSTLDMLVKAGSIQQGVVVYNGDRVLPFSDRLAAIPLGALL